MSVYDERKLNKALIAVAAQEDGRGIGRIRMKRIGDLAIRSSSWSTQGPPPQEEHLRVGNLLISSRQNVTDALDFFERPLRGVDVGRPQARAQQLVPGDGVQVWAHVGDLGTYCLFTASPWAYNGKLFCLDFDPFHGVTEAPPQPPSTC